MKKKYDIKTTDVETLKKWYHLMTLGRALDEKAPSYLLQSLGWSYHAPYAGHDGIQLAIGQVFTLGEDFLFPYYRDMLTVLSARMTPEEIILNGISKATDPDVTCRTISPNRNGTSKTFLLQRVHTTFMRQVWHGQWYIMDIKESPSLLTENLPLPKDLYMRLSMAPALNVFLLFL
mgnify:CR=1 FL=1